MITYNIDVLIGKDNTDHKPVIKCHDTGVNFLVNLKTEHRASKWRTTVEPYTIPPGATAVIKVTKPDKHYVVQDGFCQGSGVIFEPHPQTFTAVGVASAEVNIFGKDGRRITSGTFYIDVAQECADDCAEDSQTYVSVMGQQIQAAIDAADRAEEAAKRAENTEGGGEVVSPEDIQQAVDDYMGEHPIEEADPTVPEWAKQPTKPSYTAEEVGALPEDTEIPTVPDTLPNPKKLHFSGAGKASYDGSEEVTITIPDGEATFYVTFTEIEGTYTADKEFAEVLAKHKAGVPVMCKIQYGGINFILPLCALAGDTTAIYGGTAGTSSILVQHTLAGAVFVETAGLISSPATAEVGQTIVVKAVDENGVPTEWEAADFPSGGGGNVEWKLVSDVTSTEAASLVRATANDGLNDLLAYVLIPKIETDTGGTIYLDLVLQKNDGTTATSLVALPNKPTTNNTRYIIRADALGVGDVQIWSGSGATGATKSSTSEERNLKVRDVFANGGKLLGVQVFWNVNNTLPVGTHIQLWGR